MRIEGLQSGARTKPEREAEHQRLEQAETEESQELGLAEWEVRVELESHRQTTELADQLVAEGMEPVRRWRYLVRSVAISTIMARSLSGSSTCCR